MLLGIYYSTYIFTPVFGYNCIHIVEKIIRKIIYQSD